MITNQSYPKARKVGNSMSVTLTEQLKALGITEDAKVLVYVEEVEGKKRIIVEGVKNEEKSL
jgi:antitoxin component of MazEF toxin-antitoxin module